MNSSGKVVSLLPVNSISEKIKRYNPITLYYIIKSFNPLPNDKILDWSKLKAFADDKFVLESVENIVGKGENVGLPAFSPFPTMFSKSVSLRVIENWDCVVKS